jgi:hypothetical protein
MLSRILSTHFDEQRLVQAVAKQAMDREWRHIPLALSETPICTASSSNGLRLDNVWAGPAPALGL